MESPLIRHFTANPRVPQEQALLSIFFLKEENTGSNTCVLALKLVTEKVPIHSQGLCSRTALFVRTFSIHFKINSNAAPQLLPPSHLFCVGQYHSHVWGCAAKLWLQGMLKAPAICSMVRGVSSQDRLSRKECGAAGHSNIQSRALFPSSFCQLVQVRCPALQRAGIPCRQGTGIPALR